MSKALILIILLLPVALPAAPGSDKIKTCYKKVVGEKIKKKLSKAEIAKIKECIKK